MNQMQDIRLTTIRVQEQDFTNNLFWLDYGARQYDPTRGQFTTPDPLAEKYYSTNYFTYCMNNPMKFIDPDGRKSHNWIKRQQKDNDARDFPIVNDKNRYDDKVINIFIHGLKKYHKGKYPTSEEYKAVGIEISFSGIGKLDVHANNKKEVKDFASAISRSDEAFSDRSAGSPIIVIHGCATSDFALELSGTTEFRDIIIIAPDNNITLTNGTNGKQYINNVYEIGPNTTRKGQWHVYKNGKTVNDKNGKPITYPSNAQPGTNGFNYKFK